MRLHSARTITYNGFVCMYGYNAEHEIRTKQCSDMRLVVIVVVFYLFAKQWRQKY